LHPGFDLGVDSRLIEEWRTVTTTSALHWEYAMYTSGASVICPDL
jgi:hypothetical protein